MTNTDQIPLPPPAERLVGWWGTTAKYALGLAPFVIVWVVLVVWLAYLISASADRANQADEEIVREWLEQTRPFSKTLPEVVKEYHEKRAQATADGEGVRLEFPRAEIEEQLKAMAEPTRAYESKLPGFPLIYTLEVVLPGTPDETIRWENPLPRPREPNRSRVREMKPMHPVPDDPRVEIRCQYQLHTFTSQQDKQAEERRLQRIAQVVLIAATLVAGVFVYRFLRRELRRENDRLVSAAAAEHRERELLETKLRQREAEREKEELDRKLLEQQLAAATLEKRADEAEKTTLEMKSQLYAGIGIMAGSYAHNIKNLLVRPNDLLNRCIESDELTDGQQGMLQEVKSTLGTVTERLQQILKTVRRDTGKPDLTRIDLGQLARDTAVTWGDMARDKWKLRVVAHAPPEPLTIRGDLSHLQQAIENLVFNARDATFEMRNYLREEARKAPPESRKQKLIDAAGWKGEVSISTRRDGAAVVFEVRDNGIGMTAEVRQNCLTTHFSTKRDNAIYEGYTAGMGLGLSFVAMVIEHHGATIEIDSAPLHGATFRIRFQAADG